MLTIEYQPDAVPTFRIFEDSPVAQIVVVMVQEQFGERESVWVIGPPGMTMTEHEPGELQLIEHRPATTEDVRQIRQRSEQLLSGLGRPRAAIQYGVIPQGFNQMKPANSSPAPLAAGQKYEFVVVAAGDFGSLEFVA